MTPTVLTEMANVRPSTTGLSVYIWVSPKYPGHRPRIKVMNNEGKGLTHDTFSVTISKDPVISDGTCQLSSK